MSSTWLFEALGDNRRSAANIEASRRLVSTALDLPASSVDDSDLRFAAQTLELAVFEEIASADIDPGRLTRVAGEAFQLFRVAAPATAEPLGVARWMLRTACLGVLGDRGTDASRYLKESDWPALTQV
jgi:hypothetical protein